MKRPRYRASGSHHYLTRTLLLILAVVMLIPVVVTFLYSFFSPSEIKAFMGTFRAGFWHTFGRFFGVNMKDGYSPGSNRNDALIERICVRLEQGAL